MTDFSKSHFNKAVRVTPNRSEIQSDLEEWGEWSFYRPPLISDSSWISSGSQYTQGLPNSYLSSTQKCYNIRTRNPGSSPVPRLRL